MKTLIPWTSRGLEGTIESLEHESVVLAGNPLGDPHIRRLRVYLPRDYAEQPHRRFPVVYCLSGFAGTGVLFLNLDPWTPNLPQRLEALMAQGQCGPMILVMPDCFTRFGGSQYLNSTATGRYEDYLVQEIIPFVDRRFRTLASARHRGIMGKSSGGYGAIVQAMRHPEVFQAAVCHSGDMYFEYCYLSDFPKAWTALRKQDGLIGFLEHFDAEPKKSDESMAAINLVAMSASYSPNPLGEPMGFDLPFDLETGEIRGDIWAQWLAHDPVRLLPTGAEALRAARLIYFDCGTRDEWNLHLGARILSARLNHLKIPHVHEEFDDTHMRINYRYDRSLPLLWEALRE